MKIKREWAMPNSNTFEIKPIAKLVKKYTKGYGADAFARNSKMASITNDLDPSTESMYNMDAIDFINSLKDDTLDYFLFDPPYSPRQMSECYKKMGKTVTMQDTQSSFWSKIKKSISKKVKVGGHCLTFGWCSNGIGKTNGFEIIEILMIAHGGWHNDTICTVERRVK